jgi:hypothetical protein
MRAQIRAELLKIRTTRTTIGLILGMIALILLFTLLDGLLSHASALGSKEDQRQLLSVSSFTAVFAALAGVLLVTSEYRYGTIRPTFLFNPVRSRVLAAKAVAGALAGLVFGILGEAIDWVIGYGALEGRGITVVLGSSDILPLTLGGLASAALWGTIGAGIGAIIHSQVGGIPSPRSMRRRITHSGRTERATPLGHEADNDLADVILISEKQPLTWDDAVGLARIELATSALSVLRSNRLSYSPAQGPPIYPAGAPSTMRWVPAVLWRSVGEVIPSTRRRRARVGPRTTGWRWRGVRPPPSTRRPLPGRIR